MNNEDSAFEQLVAKRLIYHCAKKYPYIFAELSNEIAKEFGSNPHFTGDKIRNICDMVEERKKQKENDNETKENL